MVTFSLLLINICEYILRYMTLNENEVFQNLNERQNK